MVSWLRQMMSLVPLLVVFAYWHKWYRSKELRIRIMALTAALGAFLGLSLHSILLLTSSDVRSFTADDLVTNLVISVLFGGTFLTWWPILGKGLRRVGIRW